MKKQKALKTPWDLPVLVMAILLYGNFVTIAVLCVAAIGRILLEPAAVMVTCVLLILGIAVHLVCRRRCTKLWRRLLLGAVAANFFVVAFFILVAVMMILAWT